VTPTCPRCGAPIAAENVSPELRLMRCDACGETFPYGSSAPVPQVVARVPVGPAPWPLRSWSEGDDLVVRYYPLGEGLFLLPFWTLWTAASTLFVWVGWVMWFWPFLALAVLFAFMGYANLGTSLVRSVRITTLRIGPAGVRLAVLGRETLNLPLDRISGAEVRLQAPVVVAKNGQTFELIPVRWAAADWLASAVEGALAPGFTP
jgi:hypothetical protein